MKRYISKLKDELPEGSHNSSSQSFMTNYPDQLDPWLAANLVCLVDRQPLRLEGQYLFCEVGHRYRVINGIPIMLDKDIDPTHPVFKESIEIAEATDDMLDKLIEHSPSINGIDEYVQGMIGATSGSLYNHLRFNLKRYPIPELRLPMGHGKVFLELGCNWGRWCISASHKGYFAVGIDPSFKGVWAAQRVAKELNVPALFIVADARHLPFPQHSIDTIFSYSVLQHFGKDEVAKALSEVSRVLKRQGQCLIQLPNKFGFINLIRQLQRGFRRGEGFEVRYWSPREMVEAFSRHIGPSELSIDGFFSLNAQSSDSDLLKLSGRTIVAVSDILRELGTSFPLLANLADSLYVKALKQVAVA
jgi:SAM-dependent methyltransferase